MKKLNVGLVGAGLMGKAHSIGYSDMPKYFWPAPAVPVLKTICDIVNDPEIDVVSICTPNNVHAEIAIAALNAGKHVLCEKPIASTLEDAKAMAEAARKAVVEGRQPYTSFAEGYRVERVCDAVKRSAETGRWVTVND